MKKLLSASLALLLGWSGTALAQNEEDALRYTRQALQGSARIQGIGGAQTALGADISTMSVNPAGLGMFRRSEANISLGFTNNSTTSRFMDNTTPDERNTVNLPQGGVVFSNRKDDSDGSDWRGTAFGVSITRLSNFNQRFSYNGTVQPPNTIVDYFAEQANLNGRTKADLDDEYGDFYSLEGLAYGTYLFDFKDVYGKDTTAAIALYSVGDIDQFEEMERRGSQNQIDFAFGTSFRDKIYLGASLGIVTSNFTQERIFRESGYFIERKRKVQGEADVIESDGDYSLELRDEFTTEGAGVNLKVGVIVRPIDAIRFGVSIQTPTAYTFTETYDRSMYTTINTDLGSDNYSAAEMPGEFSYSLTTPFRANTGLAVFLGKYGFVTADAEFVDYSNMRFSEDEDGSGFGSYFSGVNSRINETYKSAMNYRIGAEGRYEVFRLRGGYAISESPYKNSAFDAKTNTLTLGAGVRLQKYYADVAYARTTGNSLYSPYTFANGEGNPIVDLDNKQTNVMFTVGMNF
ncbi:OmpP1/FadL family transporter [Pontibacter fetidus]|uniref:Outer membrane protein transport protein (OMPP1/FadL/TodX) n=1 Tax=Pontibacter fetidus TaxID=2700082 RepID=A0A6B2H7H7_9BACT|nr:hypothetical protein [Pontibacter fetidus]NDK56437.1 hypothetical protein [Pontibacter fetidus]